MKILTIISIFFSFSVCALDCSTTKVPKTISNMEPLRKRDVLENLEKEVLIKYFLDEIISGKSDRNAYQIYLALEEKNDSPDKVRALYQYLAVKANVNRPGFKNISKKEVCTIVKKLEGHHP